MKAIRHIGIFLVAALLACSCGMSKVKEITVTSVGISYIVPTSLRSMDAKLLLGINNPARGLAVQDISGTVRYEEKPIVNFVTGSLELAPKCEQVYALPCTVTLADGASLLDVLVIASKKSLDGLKADITITGALKKDAVLRAPIKIRDLDIAQFSK